MNWTRPNCIALAALGCHALMPLALAPARAQAPDVAALYRRVAPSVAVVIATDANTQPLSYGTGFVVAPRTLATNFHVIQGAQSISVKVAGRDDPILVQLVEATDTEHDLALLRVDGMQGQPLPLTTTRPTVGERLVSVGNPLGLESTVSEGIVSGIRQIGAYELYQITVPISPGSSGGPVLNARGEVVGVATASLEGGQSLNFAVPAAYLDHLLKSPSTPRPVAQAARASLRPRSDAPRDQAPVRVADVVDETYQSRPATHAMASIHNWTAVVFNGTQFTIDMVQVRVVCWRRGVDVPLGFDEVFVRSSIPAGLSRGLSFRCRRGTTTPEFRILDYLIVR